MKREALLRSANGPGGLPTEESARRLQRRDDGAVEIFATWNWRYCHVLCYKNTQRHGTRMTETI